MESTRQGRPRVRRLRDVFFHLRPGGVLVLGHLEERPDGGQGTPSTDLRAFVRHLLTLKDERAVMPKGQHDRDDHQLAMSLGEVGIHDGHAVLENRTSAFAKLREEEVDTVLDLRGDELGRVLERRPPLVFAARSTVRLSNPDLESPAPGTYDVPAVSLREYHDVVCAPGQLVVRDNLLLPDTYRHNQRRRLKNLYTEELSPLFARPRHELSEIRPLEGDYFYLDSEFRGHFGHALTEVMGRLWAWSTAKRAVPGLKALMAENKGRKLAGFEASLFGAAGIDRDDIVMTSGPVRVERLLAPTPMFSMPAYVHPDLAETWRTIGRNLAAQAPEREYPARIFCSRRVDKRPCRNSVEVEEMFADHGFEVIYPEDFSLAEQARVFRDAEVVAGFGGSGLFSLAFCEEPKRVVIVSPESYLSPNEYMIAAVLGHEVDHVLSKPDESDSAYYWESGFSVDWDREGVYLKDLLSSL